MKNKLQEKIYAMLKKTLHIFSTLGASLKKFFTRTKTEKNFEKTEKIGKFEKLINYLITLFPKYIQMEKRTIKTQLKDLLYDTTTAIIYWLYPKRFLKPLTFFIISGLCFSLGIFLKIEGKEWINIASTLLGAIFVNSFTSSIDSVNLDKRTKEKAEYTVRILNDKLEIIFLKNSLSEEDMNNARYLLDLIDYWKDYYDAADTSKINYHKKLELAITQTKTDKERTKLEMQKTYLENTWVNNGLASFIQISGSTMFNYNK